MSGQIRRVVTGHNHKGEATVLMDGPAPFVHVNPRNPDDTSTDIWRTSATPAQILSELGETTLGPRRQMPDSKGTVIRINRFAPETDQVRNMSMKEARLAFKALGNEPASTFGRGGHHPLMHRTETIDYAIILSGEITMVLDDQEVHLKSGDTVVQCGTNHAWSNRSNEVCEVLFVLIDGKFDSDLENRFPNS